MQQNEKKFAFHLRTSKETHNTGAMSSNPAARVTKEMPLARKATGNHIITSTSLEKTPTSISGFCYARNRVCNAGFS